MINKIFVVTSIEYQSFIVGVANQYAEKHAIGVTTDIAHEKPGDYDVGISFMYTKKVPKEHLTVPWFNFHPAPLPEYKGRDLCYHAIMNGETSFGATVHYMDEGFDTGDIIEVVRQFMFPSDTADTLSERTIKLSKELFIRYLPKILENTVFPRTPNVGGTYYKKGLINDVIDLGDDCEWLGKEVRAIYYPPHYPRIDIGGVKYKIVREE